MAYQSEIALAQLKGLKEYEIVPSEEDIPEGKDREAIVKVRVNQNFFRQMILSGYRIRCSVCALPKEDLLVAGHIIPWSIDASLRMNPRNGICMCVLHDKAFDNGLITIDDNYKITLSSAIKTFAREISIQRGFIAYEGSEIKLPDRFIPDKKFIEFHRNNIFEG